MKTQSFRLLKMKENAEDNNSSIYVWMSVCECVRQLTESIKCVCVSVQGCLLHCPMKRWQHVKNNMYVLGQVDIRAVILQLFFSMSLSLQDTIPLQILNISHQILSHTVVLLILMLQIAF